MSSTTPQGPYLGPPAGPSAPPVAPPAPPARRPALLAGALAAAVVLLGGGFLAGRSTAPKGPATLAAAFQQAAQGKLPCGSSGGSGGGGFLQRACSGQAGGFGGGAGGAGGRGGGGGGALLGPGSVTGQVTQASASQLTVRTVAGALTLKLNPSTVVLTTTTSGKSALATGARVVVSSTANADGSRVAQRVLLLPATGQQG